MAKGMTIDILAGPPPEEMEDESAEGEDSGAAPRAPKEDPDALIANIQSQLDQLRAALSGL